MGEEVQVRHWLLQDWHWSSPDELVGTVPEGQLEELMQVALKR